MRYKCDHCDKPASVHSVDIVNGKKIEKHLCDECASLEPGMQVKTGHQPITELLSTFVKMHGGPEVSPDMVCESCGLTYIQFQQSSLLGCPQCYTAYAPVLETLLERAHEGGSHHVGKVPRRAGGDSEQKQFQLARLRQRLDDAVAAEDYELAASLRDEIQHFEIAQ